MLQLTAFYTIVSFYLEQLFHRNKLVPKNLAQYSLLLKF